MLGQHLQLEGDLLPRVLQHLMFGHVTVLPGLEISLQVLLTSLVGTPGRLSNVPGGLPGILVLLIFPDTGDTGVDICDVTSPAVSTPSLAVTTDHTVSPATVLPSPGVPLTENPAKLGPRLLNQLHPVARALGQLGLLLPQSVQELSSLSSGDK